MFTTRQKFGKKRIHIYISAVLSLFSSVFTSKIPIYGVNQWINTWSYVHMARITGFRINSIIKVQVNHENFQVHSEAAVKSDEW